MVKMIHTVFFTTVLIGFMGLKERSSRSQFSEPSRKDIVSKSVSCFGFFRGFDGVRGVVVVDSELSRPSRRLAIKAASSAAEGPIVVTQRDVVWIC